MCLSRSVVCGLAGDMTLLDRVHPQWRRVLPHGGLVEGNLLEAAGQLVLSPWTCRPAWRHPHGGREAPEAQMGTLCLLPV